VALFLFLPVINLIVLLIQTRLHLRQWKIMNKGVHLGQSPECRLFYFIIKTIVNKNANAPTPLFLYQTRNEVEK